MLVAVVVGLGGLGGATGALLGELGGGPGMHQDRGQPGGGQGRGRHHDARVGDLGNGVDGDGGRPGPGPMTTSAPTPWGVRSCCSPAGDGRRRGESGARGHEHDRDDGRAATARGLSTAEAADRLRRGESNTAPNGSTRSYATILRTNVFSFFNIILFVIGVGAAGAGPLQRRADQRRARPDQRADQRDAGDPGQAQARPAAAARPGAGARRPRRRARSRSRRTRSCAATCCGCARATRSSSTARCSTGGSRPTSRCSPASPTRSSRTPATTCARAACAWRATGHQLARDVGAASYAGRLTADARRVTTDATPLQRRIAFVVRLVMALTVLMSGAILAQAAARGLHACCASCRSRRCCPGWCPTACSSSSPSPTPPGAAPDRRVGALVQQVNAVESVSNVDVVCTDKTGTLTTGRLRSTEVEPLGGRAPAPPWRRCSARCARSAATPQPHHRGAGRARCRASAWTGPRRGAVHLVAALVRARHRPTAARGCSVRPDALAPHLTRPLPDRRRGRPHPSGLRVLVLARAPTRGAARRRRAARRCRGWSRSRSSRSPTSCAPRSPRRSPGSATDGVGAQGALRRRPAHRRRARHPGRARRRASRCPARARRPRRRRVDRLVARTTVFGRVAPEHKERLVASLRRAGPLRRHDRRRGQRRPRAQARPGRGGDAQRQRRHPRRRRHRARRRLLRRAAARPARGPQDHQRHRDRRCTCSWPGSPPRAW